MIWRRLRKATKEEEIQFGKMMEEEKVGCRDQFAMLVSAFFVVFLPAAGVLIAFGALILWIMSLLF